MPRMPNSPPWRRPARPAHRRSATPPRFGRLQFAPPAAPDDPPGRSGFARSVRRPPRRRCQPVALGRQGGADTGVGPAIGNVACGGGVGIGRHYLSVRKMVGQPMPHLGGRHRERRHRAHLLGGRTGTRRDAECDVQGEFGMIRSASRPPGCPWSAAPAFGIEFSIGTRRNRRHSADRLQCRLGAHRRPRFRLAPPGTHSPGGHRTSAASLGPLGTEIGDGPRPPPNLSAAGATVTA